MAIRSLWNHPRDPNKRPLPSTSPPLRPDEASAMLSEEQKRFYDSFGYVLLDDVFTVEEVDDISRAYDSVFARYVLRQDICDTVGGVVL